MRKPSINGDFPLPIAMFDSPRFDPTRWVSEPVWLKIGSGFPRWTVDRGRPAAPRNDAYVHNAQGVQKLSGEAWESRNTRTAVERESVDSCHVKQKDPLTLRSIGIESTGIALALFILGARTVKVFFLG